jgi:hypothetical protein
MCGYVYWSRWEENWGTCDYCDYNNDIVPKMMSAIGEGPRLIADSSKIFKFLDENDNVVEKSIYIKESIVPVGGSNIQERLRRIIENGDDRK